ncbi:hypothetical protein [uncultured Sphingomonas sp.]|uniref:hypothetical protein n=1 Tax=uncultured Sphingomonas sp. TaxID=158754 RepID=UPI0025CDC109|nr:hypothetical protein [uncultured Sphingomonas sp.]
MRGNEHLELLRFVGEALYGERWQAPIAGDLGVSDRAVRYWISAANPCPEDLGLRLLAIVVRKRDSLAGLEKVVLRRLKMIGELS